jgi:hypothetical protein
MNKEITPDMKWATRKLIKNDYPERYWDYYLKVAAKDLSGMHEQIALVLIAKGIYPRPVGKVIKKLQKEGLADGAGIDSARNR